MEKGKDETDEVHDVDDVEKLVFPPPEALETVKADNRSGVKEKNSGTAAARTANRRQVLTQEDNRTVKITTNNLSKENHKIQRMREKERVGRDQE